LDNRDEIITVARIDMKNSPLTTILLAVLFVSALASVVLCLLFIYNTRQLRSLREQANAINFNNVRINALASETMEYSKTHPAIDPILEAVGLKPGKSAAAGTNKPEKK
jgi:type II secretory pathway component GspD/PulD (secretin)